MRTFPLTLALPPRVFCHPGAIAGILEECATFGQRGMLVHGQSLAVGGVLNRILDGCPDELRVTTWQHAGGEPTLEQLDATLAAARACRADWIAAVGGGSVMDLGKACAGLLHAPLATSAYHGGETIPASRVPFAAAPTTAGTGGEATGVSVLTDTRLGVKKSIRHPSFVPRVVVLDAELLAGCPPNVIACSGMDAFVQAVESFVSRDASAFSDACASAAVRMINRALVSVFRGATGAPAQELLEGSFLAGIALSHARLGLVHGLAHPLGLRYQAAHGLVCAVCLPAVIDFNRGVAAHKFSTLQDILGSDIRTYAEALLQSLHIASPFRGQPLRDREAIIAETLASGSSAANPRPVTADDVSAMLDTIFAA